VKLPEILKNACLHALPKVYIKNLLKSLINVDTVVIWLSPHLDLGVLMRTYPNVADLALYCSSLCCGSTAGKKKKSLKEKLEEEADKKGKQQQVWGEVVEEEKADFWQ
jgi:hypothetical protein